MTSTLNIGGVAILNKGFCANKNIQCPPTHPHQPTPNSLFSCNISWGASAPQTPPRPLACVAFLWPLADDSESGGVGTGRKQRRQWNWWGDHWQGGSGNWWLSTGKSLGNWWGEYYQSRFTDHPDSQSTPTKDHHQHSRIPQNWYFHTTHKQQNIKNNWNPL